MQMGTPSRGQGAEQEKDALLVGAFVKTTGSGGGADSMMESCVAAPGDFWFLCIAAKELARRRNTV